MSDAQVLDMEKDIEAQQHETSACHLRDAILDEVTEKHPIYYDRFNLCELYQKDRLNKFNIDMLVRICKHFDLEVSDVSRGRKEGFICRIKQVVQSCSCCM